MNFNRKTLELAGANLRKLEQLVVDEKEMGRNRLEAEYRSLVQRLARQTVISGEAEMLSNPILTHDLLQESIPGNMRRAEHFLPVLRKLIVCFKDLLHSKDKEV